MAEFTVELSGGPHAGVWLVGDAEGYSWPLPREIPAGDGVYKIIFEDEHAQPHRRGVYRFSSELCRHELPVYSCAECRPRPPSESTDAERWEGLAAAKEGGGLGPVIEARYGGQCASCGVPFGAGDDIRACDALGDWIGVSCGCGAP